MVGVVRTLNGAEDELVDEFLLQVVNHHALGAEGQSLLLDGLVVLVLADICKEALRGSIYMFRSGVWRMRHTTTV